MRAAIKLYSIVLILFPANAFCLELVSSDGGFFESTRRGKRPVSHIEKLFQFYKFLKEDDSIILHRAKKIAPPHIALKYTYRKVQIRQEDWRSALKIKCRKEYIPTLETVFSASGARFFFFNQYSDDTIIIHGEASNKIFALSFSKLTRPSAGRLPGEWVGPYWQDAREVDISLSVMKNIKLAVGKRKDSIIKKYLKKNHVFNKNYDFGY